MNKPYDLIISSAALLEPLYTQYLAEYFEVAWHRCPRCQGLRHGHGGHERWVLCAPGQEGRLFLRHVRCRSCHTVETVFPPWLLPYERLTVDLIDLSGDPNIFPNTGIALATRAVADLGELAGGRRPAVALGSAAGRDTRPALCC